jgi:SAM-dependent methyltransferase
MLAPACDAAPSRPALRGMVRAAIFHYGRLAGNGFAALRALRGALAATPAERVLDVGCGTGGFSLAVPGEYVGIDLDPDYVAFARRRWGGPRRRFEVVSLDALDAGVGFDAAFMVNVLHHLSDAAAGAVFERLATLVRRRLVVIDADPGASNRFQAFLLRHDRGDFIRPVEAQRALLARVFRVTQEGRFRNTPRTLVQSLFVCEPRAAFRP